MTRQDTLDYMRHVRRPDIFLFLALIVALFPRQIHSQTKDSTSASHRNIGLLAGCSILEGNGIRAELPAYFYSSRRHGFSVAAAGKFSNDNPLTFGINAGYFCFIEPSFRDITFFLNYNTAYYFEKDPAFTHIFAIGTQIDIGKRGFIQHSVGFGFQQSATDFNWVATAAQLKLSFGIYLREIPVVHIHDDWEK